MATGFEFFEGSATEGTLGPRVTIRKGGQLILTQAAIDLMGEGTTHVQVGFNLETKAIGIRAADEDTKGRYRLRQQKSSACLLVDGKRLFALHGMEVAKAHTVDAEEFGDGIIGFHLAGAAKVKANGPNGAKPAARSKSSRSAS